MKEFGLYLVCGKRAYAGVEPGEEFMARLDRNAERRALERGSLQLVARVTPTIVLHDCEFDQGWLDTVRPAPVTATAGREGS